LAIPYGSKKEMHNLYDITEIKMDKRGTGLKRNKDNEDVQESAKPRYGCRIA
jgi:hypothetical protein